jgi:hypothetical protein
MSDIGNQYETKLYVLVGKKYSGPINFSMWSHHAPSQITKVNFLSILGFEGDVTPNTQLRLYHVGKKSFLDDNKTYAEQQVGPFDIIALTDMEDKNMIEPMMHVIIKSREEDNSQPTKKIDPKQFKQILEDF